MFEAAAVIVRHSVPGWQVAGLQRRTGRRLQTRSVPRASNSDGSNNEGSGVDWDKAWSSFKKNVAAQLPEVESRVTTQAPRFAERRGSWNAGQQQEDIKRQERFLLNYWSQDTFFKGGGIAVIALFVLLLVLAGPPPSDGRCTLPWC